MSLLVASKIGFLATIGTHNSPSVASVRTSVPEQHPGMTTTLKHFEPGEMPPATEMLGGLTIAPAMAAIVVDRVPIVDPQVAPII